MEEVTKTTINIRTSIWKKFRQVCIDNDTNATVVIIDMIKKYIKENG